MKKITGLSIVWSFIVLLVSCNNPLSRSQDELDKKSDELREQSHKTDEAEYQADTYKRYLNSMVITSNYLWIKASGTDSYGDAVATCEEIDYSLPTEAELAEFQSEYIENIEDEERKAALQETYIFILGDDDGLEKHKSVLGLGMVLCKKDKI